MTLSYIPCDAIVTTPLAICGSEDGNFRLLCNKIDLRSMIISGKTHADGSLLKGRTRQAVLFPYVQPFELAAVRAGIVLSDAAEGDNMLMATLALMEKGETVTISDFSFEYTKPNEISFTCLIKPGNVQSDSWNALLAILNMRKIALGAT